MSLRVENFGCRLNALEGDSVEALAKTAGLEKTTIINGCAVTHEALRQARQAARKAKRDGQNGDCHRMRGANRCRKISPPCRKLTAFWAMKKNCGGQLSQ